MQWFKWESSQTPLTPLGYDNFPSDYKQLISTVTPNEVSTYLSIQVFKFPMVVECATNKLTIKVHTN